MSENLPANTSPASPTGNGSAPRKPVPAKTRKTTADPAKRAADAKTLAAKVAAKPRRTQAEMIAEAVSAALAEERAKATPVRRETGYRARLAQGTPAAMIGFTLWMAKEFPELKIDVDPKTGRATDRFEKLVTIASKEYRAFQAVRHQFGY
jgi:hypothetical protein